MTVFIRGTKRFISLGKNRIHPTKRTGLTAGIVITIIRPFLRCVKVPSMKGRPQYDSLAR